MAKRLPKGVVIRPLPDWLMDQMMGGRVSQAGASGQITYGELYNNASDGSLLYLYGVSWYSSPGDEGVPEVYFWKKQVGGGGQFPLRASGTVLPGVVGGFTSVGCVGNEIGSVVAPTTNSMPWLLPFPMAIIDPGYSFGIHTAGTNELVRVGLWWLAARGL